MPFVEHPTLEDYEQSDRETRIYTQELVKKSQLSAY
jgi:hypothetical protein